MKEYQDTVNNLTEQREDLLEIVTIIQSDYAKGFFHIFFLDELNIKGDLLKKFYYECCDGDKYKALLTLNMLETGMFDLYDILKNLNLDNPLPFFNPNIKSDENPLNPTFYNYLKKQNLFCILQKSDFRERLKNKLRNDKTI